jgi:hypothetical protein
MQQLRWRAVAVVAVAKETGRQKIDGERKRR